MVKERQEADGQGTEGARRATGVSWPSGQRPAEGQMSGQMAGVDGSPAQKPDAEVSEKATRCRFTIEYKMRILKLADECTTAGSVGALLRKEGLYSSTLTSWRRQRKEGTVSAGRKRGRKPVEQAVLENQKLTTENQGLKENLRQAELIVDVQKKLLQLLEYGLKSGTCREDVSS
jgi:transposase-like protein